MKEARLIVPYVPSLASLEEALTEDFGGFTKYSGQGWWKDPSGDTIREEVNVFDIAYDPDAWTDIRLFEIAKQFREDHKQVEVYLRYGSGDVQMVGENSLPLEFHSKKELEIS